MTLRRWFAPLAAAALGLVVAGCASGPLNGEDDEGSEAERNVLRGVTVTTPQDPEATIEAIAALDPEPTVRLVLDPALTGGTDEDLGNDRGVGLGQYRRLIEGLDPYARLMVQVADSTELARLSADDIEQRTRALIDAFGERVDIWEVGNEINGAWAGSGPDEIIEKTASRLRPSPRSRRWRAATWG